MIRDILRFNREAPRAARPADDAVSLGDYLDAQRLLAAVRRALHPADGRRDLVRRHRTLRSFPGAYFVRFFHNHGMLSWTTGRSGARSAAARRATSRSSRRRSASASGCARRCESVRRTPAGVVVKAAGCEAERFDRVFFACHSDQALRLLADPSAAEREVLGAIRYQHNEVVLHTDTRLLPRRRLAWAAWNYHVRRTAHRDASPSRTT